ncbi:MAG: 16S rRNA (cytidine(1402)-2'-O)-methyltransferase, partial [Clostridia bacterium]|nr:16S rRNA (cytidine(1402)-2'-O)-methyltransferase [Clostridia bacterium]
MNAEKNKVEGGTLYLVATPIGNLADLSERAVKVLSEVDFVAAEDTRNSGLLLSRFGISKPFVSYFEHNKRERGEYIVSRLKAGESCALVTDAGMPAISDPGEDIVRLCAEVGVPVTAVPGCCAAITALALSALTTGRFAFEGFITTNRHDRRERLTALKYEERTMIFYEAPHKLRQTLDDILEFMGDRRITLCREMTKLNEEIIRTTVSEAVEMYKEKNPRGEYVLVLEGGIKEDKSEDFPSAPEEHVKMYESQGMKRMD